MSTPRDLLTQARATLATAERDLADGRLVDFGRSIAFAKATLAELDRKFSGSRMTQEQADGAVARALLHSKFDDGTRGSS